MKTELAAALVEGQRVDTVFSLRTRELRSTRYGEAYLSLEFADRSGAIGGVMFKPTHEAESIPAGTVVHVRGVVTAYRGVKRVSVEDMRPAERYEIADLLPRSPRERKQAVKQLRALADSIRDAALARLVKAVFGDAAFFRAFAALPASVADHRVYVGGLLEHTVAVASACRACVEQYPDADADLLLAGALLHDIGIVDSIRLGSGFEQTTEGRLLGHPILGERRVASACERLTGSVDRERMTHLAHLVLSHHGDDGGWLAPCSLEALVLSRVDALDRDASSFTAAVRGALRVEEEWTDSGNRFGRPLYAAAGARARSA
ncbi:MAG: HD domain-containing protein [Anaerosomatales bacterium]|nr:HD domain-containing protein [Anaerosomatales bacterium]